MEERERGEKEEEKEAKAVQSISLNRQKLYNSNERRLEMKETDRQKGRARMR